jgi:hypothetical protein
MSASPHNLDERVAEAAGFERIRFSEEVPFWCAVGFMR